MPSSTAARPMIDKPAAVILLRKVGRQEITADQAITLLDGWVTQAVPVDETQLAVPMVEQLALAGPDS